VRRRLGRTVESSTGARVLALRLRHGGRGRLGLRRHGLLGGDAARDDGRPLQPRLPRVAGGLRLRQRQRELGAAEPERQAVAETVDELGGHRERRVEGHRVVLRRLVERGERVAPRPVVDEQHRRRAAGDGTPHALDHDEPRAVGPTAARRSHILHERHVIDIGIQHARSLRGRSDVVGEHCTPKRCKVRDLSRAGAVPARGRAARAARS
jgi:hypothetical protein